MTAQISMKEMLVDPSSHWREPQDILTDKRLNNRQRLDLLTAWERDARALSVAADENMQGGEEARLGPVVSARIIVEELMGIEADPDKGTHDKFGGR
jgi:hypothetical protein